MMKTLLCDFCYAGPLVGHTRKNGVFPGGVDYRRPATTQADGAYACEGHIENLWSHLARHMPNRP